MTRYDRLNRATHVYRGFGEDDTCVDALSVTENVILEEPETVYDDAGNAIQTTHRYHDAPANQTGPLGSPSVIPKARVTDRPAG